MVAPAGERLAMRGVVQRNADCELRNSFTMESSRFSWLRDGNLQLATSMHARRLFPSARCTVALVAAAALAVPARAQQPDTLQHALDDPTTNPQEGAQQGFSVATDGGLVVVGARYDDMGGKDRGVVNVYDSATGALLRVLANPSPAEGDQFGSSVVVSGTRVVVGAPYNDTGANNAGSVYVYDLASATPSVPVATLNKPTPGAGGFGSSVAVSGTYVVVGAYSDDAAGLNEGSVYVYDLAGATPTAPVATLSNPNSNYAGFGYAVAMSGTRLVVGEHLARSAYVYDLTSATPSVPVATLNKPTPGVGGFGQSVAVWDTHVVVGAPGEYSGGLPVGSAYVYDLASATPSVPVATLSNPTPATFDNFGSSVAVSGTRVVIVAPYDDTGARHTGCAYVYDLASATPNTPVFTLNNPTPAVTDLFGWSVAISGTRAVVGAPRDDPGVLDGGRAYLYDLAAATPTVPVATLNNPSPSETDYFGVSVAMSGTRVVVGAYGSDVGAAAAGSAYVYDLASATPTVPVITFHNPSPAEVDAFGRSVAMSGTRVVVGAYGDNTGAENAGSAYVYDLASATPTDPVATLNNPSPAAIDLFGWSVAISGTRVVVGGYWDDTGAADAGSAYVYDLASATPTVPVATLHNPSPAAGDSFGESVAVSGTLVAVGAHADDTGAMDAGSAYVYDLGSTTPTIPVTTLNNPDPGVNDWFGISLAISGTHVVIGASQDDTGAADAGSAYVYDLASATPSVPWPSSTTQARRRATPSGPRLR